MKFPAILSAMIIAVAMGLVALGFVAFRSILAPPPITFDSVAVEDVTPYSARVVAVVERAPLPDGCTNGIQADVRKFTEPPTRLPVPLRTQDRSGRSVYALVLPQLYGRYEVQVRETFLCSDRLRVIKTPWVRMDIPAGLE